MKNQNPTAESVGVGPKVTLIMELCGMVLSVATANAAASDEDVPRKSVRYSHASLATDSGARAVYRHIVMAAETVCPQQSESRFVSASVQQCRNDAIARAVLEIHNPRLVALHGTSSKIG